MKQKALFPLSGNLIIDLAEVTSIRQVGNVVSFTLTGLQEEQKATFDSEADAAERFRALMDYLKPEPPQPARRERFEPGRDDGITA